MSDEIVFDEFREDVRREDGSLIQANVLFIRATRGNLSYHCPIWQENGYAEGIDVKQDVRDLLALSIERAETGEENEQTDG